MIPPKDLDALLSRLRARIGAKAQPTARLVEPGALVKFARATNQTDPCFLDLECGPVAPPTYISTFCAVDRRHSGSRRRDDGRLCQ